jgi:hypothetical protein
MWAYPVCAAVVVSEPPEPEPAWPEYPDVRVPFLSPLPPAGCSVRQYAVYLAYKNIMSKAKLCTRFDQGNLANE